MLEKVPAPIGRVLESVRAGMDKLVWADAAVQAPDTIVVESAAFVEDGAMSALFTADGEGVSPPLAWRGVPAGATALILVVEDADSPTPAPFVHALAYGFSPEDQALAAGALSGALGDTGDPAMGQNTYGKARYLPPDPPTGHGPHRYVFQLYALDREPDLPAAASKHQVVEALKGHVIARGRLIGVYERPG
ncbi:MAG: YbhB/YbcL family Raf kinase inhibitor-like protein [Caulobacteraceae bacterium]|nr:YbhB/YbcL family Raf kinase inhibitor-like protein [Caulobacteraceae bacterium]